jgi:autotransporter-associated beta strand protein
MKTSHARYPRPVPSGVSHHLRRPLALLLATGSLFLCPSLILADTVTGTGWKGTAGGANADLWGEAANWDNTPPKTDGNGDRNLFFGQAWKNAGGGGITQPFNNLADWAGWRITFEAISPAQAFSISGNSFTLYDWSDDFPRIENQSTATQTFDLVDESNNPQTLKLRGYQASGHQAEINPVTGNLVFTANTTIDLIEITYLYFYGDNGKTVTFDAPIKSTGNNGLNLVAVQQNSTVIFGAANTYLGDTFVRAGTLRFKSGGSANGSHIQLGAPSGTAPATIVLDPSASISSPLTVQSGGAGTRLVQTSGSGSAATFAGNITLNENLEVKSETAPLNFTGTSLALGSHFLNAVGAGAVSISLVISGSSGSIAKQDAGTLALTGDNTYGGGTTVTGGKVLANNTTGSATGSGAVTVSGTGTLGGTGTAAGDIAVNSGGKVAPGGSVGTLTTGSETWARGGTLEVEMSDATSTPGTGWDLLSIADAVTDTLAVNATSGSNFTINVLGLPGLANFNANNAYCWKIVGTSAGITGFAANKFTVSVTGFGSYSGTFSVNTNQAESDLYLLYTPACVNGDNSTMTLDPNWHVTDPSPGPRLYASATFKNPRGLARVQAVVAENCAMSAQAFSATDVLLGTIASLLPSSFVDLPDGTVKVVLTSQRTPGTTARVQAAVKDACDNLKTSDPVITTIEVLAGGQVQRRIEGIHAADHYLHVINGSPGLTALEVVLNGRQFRLESPVLGQPVVADLAHAMREGDHNVLELVGYGETGASALVMMTDFASETLTELSETVRLTHTSTPAGLRLSWPETLTGLALQASAHPGISWTDMVVTPVVEDRRFVVVVPTSEAAQFYRLHEPDVSGSRAPRQGLPQGETVNSAPTKTRTATHTYDGFVW